MVIHASCAKPRGEPLTVYVTERRRVRSVTSATSSTANEIVARDESVGKVYNIGNPSEIAMSI